MGICACNEMIGKYNTVIYEQEVITIHISSRNIPKKLMNNRNHKTI